ncbi:hypothetical protein B0T26DRAFT_756657 [Lasiosphaeria miniovina]|uniref:Uncharacterized protein n=1 Tax=Lasiosphaeria miniovina TaxID=1954250 RepID=A0AA39ZSV8_9PEZI|nr:uncharacterized protein B0T26DRAFT_756657 [Lasiosphaeria miniovina]KAK0703081.1 hypothetical protein B0T26DRAFT_756657 [Lasiosphaeria miniovina]
MIDLTWLRSPIAALLNTGITASLTIKTILIGNQKIKLDQVQRNRDILVPALREKIKQLRGVFEDRLKELKDRLKELKDRLKELKDRLKELKDRLKELKKVKTYDEQLSSLDLDLPVRLSAASALAKRKERERAVLWDQREAELVFLGQSERLGGDVATPPEEAAAEPRKMAAQKAEGRHAAS